LGTLTPTMREEILLISKKADLNPNIYKIKKGGNYEK
jgi:hypothetical protein